MTSEQNKDATDYEESRWRYVQDYASYVAAQADLSGLVMDTRYDYRIVYRPLEFFPWVLQQRVKK